MLLAPALTALLLSAVPVTWSPTAPRPEDSPLTLELQAVVPPGPGRRAVFVAGRLGSPARSERALLLRSVDGGRRWHEVLPPVSDSQVLTLDFLGCEGRAWVGWTTEGPGELVLYASSDCGRTWRKRGALPKVEHTEWLEGAAWQDARRGQAWLVDTADVQRPARLLTTRDGGRTWRPHAEGPPPPAPSAAAPREPSGATWRLQEEAGTLRILRRPPGAPAEVRSVLPTTWEVQPSGRLVPARAVP